MMENVSEGNKLISLFLAANSINDNSVSDTSRCYAETNSIDEYYPNNSLIEEESDYSTLQDYNSKNEFNFGGNENAASSSASHVIEVIAKKRGRPRKQALEIPHYKITPASIEIDKWDGCEVGLEPQPLSTPTHETTSPQQLERHQADTSKINSDEEEYSDHEEPIKRFKKNSRTDKPKIKSEKPKKPMTEGTKLVYTRALNHFTNWAKDLCPDFCLTDLDSNLQDFIYRYMHSKVYSEDMTYSFSTIRTSYSAIKAHLKIEVSQKRSNCDNSKWECSSTETLKDIEKLRVIKYAPNSTCGNPAEDPRILQLLEISKSGKKPSYVDEYGLIVFNPDSANSTQRRTSERVSNIDRLKEINICDVSVEKQAVAPKKNSPVKEILLEQPPISSDQDSSADQPALIQQQHACAQFLVAFQQNSRSLQLEQFNSQKSPTEQIEIPRTQKYGGVRQEASISQYMAPIEQRSILSRPFPSLQSGTQASTLDQQQPNIHRTSPDQNQPSMQHIYPVQVNEPYIQHTSPTRQNQTSIPPSVLTQPPYLQQDEQQNECQPEDHDKFNIMSILESMEQKLMQRMLTLEEKIALLISKVDSAVHPQPDVVPYKENGVITQPQTSSIGLTRTKFPSLEQKSTLLDLYYHGNAENKITRIKDISEEDKKRLIQEYPEEDIESYLESITLVGSYCDYFQSREEFEKANSDAQHLILIEYCRVMQQRKIMRQIVIADERANELMKVRRRGFLNPDQMKELKQLSARRSKRFVELKSLVAVEGFPKEDDGIEDVNWVAIF